MPSDEHLHTFTLCIHHGLQNSFIIWSLFGGGGVGSCTKHAERVQNKKKSYSFTINELIPGLIYRRYEEPLKECRLTTLDTRRLSGGQIEVFNILKSYENIDCNFFFKIKESKTTRGHNYTLLESIHSPSGPSTYVIN